MYKGKKVFTIIGAAGMGTRMGAKIPKQYLMINGETILENTLKAFIRVPAIDEIILVISGDHIKDAGVILDKFSKSDKRISLVCGGAQRQDSIYCGLKKIEEGLRKSHGELSSGDHSIVLVHDGVRPFVSQETILDVLAKAYEKGGAVAAVKTKDTMGFFDGNQYNTLDRGYLYNIQTPQGFRFDILMESYEKAFEEGFYGTDDGSLVERAGHTVVIASGSYENIKITTKEDMPMNNRIGSGYDVHRLVPDRKLILGGVEIPFEKGLLGHSDADVMLHAFMDALLGAAGLGDIGQHFPDSDERYKGISSLRLLEVVTELIKEQGYTLGNGDITIIAQRPKIAKYIPEMKKNISQVMGITEEIINIKGTTTEGLGFAGREEGIAAEAVCILQK